MMDARAEVLGRIRAALAAGSPVPAPGSVPVPVPVPREYRRDEPGLDPGELVELFVERLCDYRATVHRCGPEAPAGTIAATIAGVLAPGGTLVVPPDVPTGWLAAYRGAVRRDHDPEPLAVADLDAASAVLTGCAVAVAVTGTIVLDAGAAQGRRALTLVPDHHVCVVRTGQIVEGVPAAVARLDPRRPLTWISGPSATSDIELDRVEGVHGPRRLEVILVG